MLRDKKTKEDTIIAKIKPREKFSSLEKKKKKERMEKS